MTSHKDIAGRIPMELSRNREEEAGRISVLAAVGAVAGAIPLPLVPSMALRRVRGAIAHDVATRYGLSLTADARDMLSEPGITGKKGAWVATFAFMLRRAVGRLGLVGLLAPTTAGLETYAFGLLLDRYFDQVRSSSAVRIQVHEAREARDLIDSAVRRSLSPRLRVRRDGSERQSSDDHRKLRTKLLDTVLLALAGFPHRLRTRLERSFDGVVAESRHAR